MPDILRKGAKSLQWKKDFPIPLRRGAETSAVTAYVQVQNDAITAPTLTAGAHESMHIAVFTSPMRRPTCTSSLTFEMPAQRLYANGHLGL